jgi:N-methylhydantoinase A/oxoprolinase/acetone carboxylase beta subunit
MESGSMPTATEQKPDTKSNGKPAPRPASLADRISQEEQDQVFRAFEELKRRGDGELRVAVKRNRDSGLIEIVYVGVHERADLSVLKEMYAQFRKQGHRF